MENTTHYHLKKWDPEDRVLRTEFNDNSDKTDAAIADARAAADNAALAAQKAMGAAQSAQDTTAQQGGSIAALQAALALRGNCQMEYGAYVGTGVWETISITCQRKPNLVIVMDVESGIFFLAVQGGKETSILGSVRDTIYLTWADKTLSWRNSSSNSIECLLNLAGRQYCWLAMTIL